MAWKWYWLLVLSKYIYLGYYTFLDIFWGTNKVDGMSLYVFERLLRGDIFGLSSLGHAFCGVKNLLIESARHL